MAQPSRYISLEFNPYAPWNRGILKGVEAYAQEQPDWHLLLHRMLPGRQVEIWGIHETAGGVLSEVPETWALERGLPQVCFGSAGEQSTIVQVRSDFLEIGRLAANHLAGKGYSHFACFALFSSQMVDQDRDAGFRTQAAALKIPISEIELPSSSSSQKVRIQLEATSALTKALRGFPRPTGFFTRNLTEAYLAHFLIQEAGLNIPNEVGLIVGGNDRDLLESLQPAVTGVSRNTYAIGYRAAQMLEGLLEGNTVERTVLVPPGGVVERDSTRLEYIGDEKVLKARKLIREGVGRSVLLGEIAHKVGLSESSLRRRFKTALRRSPVEEIQYARLELAKELLQSSTLSISQVSDRCGFAESAQLSRLIKAATGLTPTQFRSHALRVKR